MDSVVHFDLPFEDKKRAEKFYGDLFGWTFVDIPKMDYTIVRTAEVDEQNMVKETGRINGGMYKRKGDGEKTVIVISVADIDATIKNAESAGSKVLMPKNKVGEMGYYAQITDLEGNAVGIWEDIKK